MGKVVEREACRMPILDDIIDHEVLGREFKRGRLDGELAVVLSQIEKRFGSVPPRLRDRLAKMSSAEVEAVGLRLLDARSVDEL